MKIITRGLEKPATRQKKCGKCHSILEYSNEDIKTDRDGTYIICPVCQTFIAAACIITP